MQEGNLRKSHYSKEIRGRVGIGKNGKEKRRGKRGGREGRREEDGWEKKNVRERSRDSRGGRVR